MGVNGESRRRSTGEKVTELLSEHAALFLALQSRVAGYWARVDRLEGATKEPFGSFFADDVVMMLGSMRLDGKQALSDFFENREKQDIERERTTRHVTSNFRLAITTPNRATLRATVVVYSGFGAWPLPVEAPSGLGDFSFDCVKDADGAWRFVGITASSVFAGATAPAFAKKQDGKLS